MADFGVDIHKAKAILASGELVGLPTETVYGLAGNGFDEDAVAKIFEVKNRPNFDPLILHASSVDRVEGFVTHIPAKLKPLADAFWPGPLTLLLPRKSNVPDLVTSGLDTVAVRIPSHPLTRSLLEILDFPLAAPSANPFGYISPTLARHVDDQLGDKIPYILDGGQCDVGLESTIVGLEAEEITIYRLGGLDIASIEQVVGEIKVMAHSSSNPKAPGQLKSHYAPSKPFVIGNIDELVASYREKGEKFAILTLQKDFPEMPDSKKVILSPEGDLREAAKMLFAGMRILDSVDVSVILAELMPEEGLGRAINDRLKRASVKN
ncbi:L-threonylcarbamoyladenylate synthase [Belliella kenyensis]|uniref:Threonylcarbamoyl-AMP synthase n=1 Tax=Belliella kenyensis TaxID=1472724 RepID=A0ABV8EIC6_9BACT|nr:L-threonylcarbamoyladenylate synthase [Belliella kenyensis]MCH7402689.1 threonylcarbamoyl-AMP synthase [Belliella kenyensis]MDN3603763.1 L-threonylcarbamoyladenylate synthase [Belliella kenyensis]